jgi:hypothetical protein
LREQGRSPSVPTPALAPSPPRPARNLPGRCQVRPPGSTSRRRRSGSSSRRPASPPPP